MSAKSLIQKVTLVHSLLFFAKKNGESQIKVQNSSRRVASISDLVTSHGQLSSSCL